MSASTGEKIFVTVVFVVFALPPGLCSMFGMPAALISLFDRNPGSRDTALLFAVPSLIGLAFFGGMLWWLIRTWRRVRP
jgi:predicted permease